jgi:hypothetical protein
MPKPLRVRVSNGDSLGMEFCSRWSRFCSVDETTLYLYLIFYDPQPPLEAGKLACLDSVNDVGYRGQLSVEWENIRMDRIHGATKAAAFVRRLDFSSSAVAFDAAFDKTKGGRRMSAAVTEKNSLLTGKDLIDLGYKPGPKFKHILDSAQALQLEGALQTREDALAWLQKSPLP